VIKRLDLVNVLLGNLPLVRESNGASDAPGEEEPAVAKTVEPPVRRSSRKDVLEQLERGEITVQQATQLLKAN
jgi:hypothetical protein